LELRERAVRLVFESGPPVRQVPRDRGVHRESLRIWVREAEADTRGRRDLLTTDEREELKRLRKEDAELSARRQSLPEPPPPVPFEGVLSPKPVSRPPPPFLVRTPRHRASSRRIFGVARVDGPEAIAIDAVDRVIARVRVLSGGTGPTAGTDGIDLRPSSESRIVESRAELVETRGGVEVAVRGTREPATGLPRFRST
jgi:transposase